MSVLPDSENGPTLRYRVGLLEKRVDSLVRILLTLGIGLVAGMGGLIVSLVMLIQQK